ncbi:MAG TPA: hypothetical protein VMT53_13365 [Terriglobales bacterium]|nr:hypothetical protein [Terriglobales bacterium]
MRRMVLIFVAVLCTGIAAYADDMSKGKDEGKGTAMTGWLCNSKCVKPSGSKNTCDKTCTATEGDVVFIDSRGQVDHIASQDMVKPHAGKKVKMMAAMNKDSKMLEVYQVTPEYAGP